MTEELQLRADGEASLPTLIYLPGLHGDWTLISGFRQAIADRARLIEITYPRTLTWSLDDYAAAVETALAKSGIKPAARAEALTLERTAALFRTLRDGRS